MIYLPDPGTWPTTPVTPRDTLNESASGASEQQLTVAAENAPLRVIYGQVRIGPQIANVLAHNGALVILAVWGHGEIDSIVSLDLDDKPATLTATHYTGTAGQTLNAALVAAFAAQTPSIAYTDALPGICYSVVTVPAGAASGFPRLNATIKGRKVWTGAVSEWSDNPAWCTADFVTNTTYGMGRTVDWASVASVAADNNILAGGVEKMRTINLALDTVQPVQSWLDTLRTYASCWIVPSASGLKFVSDKARASVATYDHSSGNIQSLTGLKKRGVQTMPTVLTVTYRDTSTTPHRDGTATVYAAGVLAGTTPRRESQVSLPGITRYSQAFREATERLNKLLLNDLSFTLGVFDDGLTHEVGDVITVTHPLGLASKQVWISGATGEYGRYSFNVVEYDPAVYSASVAVAPTYVDTTLPNPAAPPAVSGVTMVEEVYQLENGTWASRWRVTWSAATYTYLAYYRAELWAGGTLIHAGSPTGMEWPTPAVQEGVAYTAKIAAVSSIGSVGTWATQSGVCAGKTLIPGNVSSITAFEAGGTVYASWAPAVDIDIWRYEIRYGAMGGTWDAATLLDRVDGLRLTTVQIPVGSWTLHVKALDSVQQYSATAATVAVTVTSDSNSFLVDTKLQTAPTLTNMAEYSLARTDANRYFVSEDNVAMATKFTAALSTYTQPMATYHASMTSTWLGEAEDFGLSLSGNWSGQATVAVVNGSQISYLGHSPDGSAWAYPAGLSQKINARFARLKHEAFTTSTLLVTIPDQSIRIDATPREEVGAGTSSAAGPVTVLLANTYAALKKLTITPFGATARNGVPDRLLLSGVSGLLMAYTCQGGGNAYVYWQVFASSRVFLAGDNFEYDVFIEKRPDALTTGVGGIELELPSASGRSLGLSSPYGALHNPSIPSNTWIAVKASLTPLVGMTLNLVELCNEADGAGDYKVVYRNLRITDGAGTTRVAIWSSGEPALNQNGYSSLNTNIQCGPTNSFQAYVFNDAGVKIASAFQYQFQGV